MNNVVRAVQPGNEVTLKVYRRWLPSDPVTQSGSSPVAAIRSGDMVYLPIDVMAESAYRLQYGVVAAVMLFVALLLLLPNFTSRLRHGLQLSPQRPTRPRSM